ncbi:MAG: hypothetical protein Q8S31_04030 [Alphaproteobacteria bacterium]|nr:hypothetical protein [Alphaproteobacteria bacterium]
MRVLLLFSFLLLCGLPIHTYATPELIAPQPKPNESWLETLKTQVESTSTSDAEVDQILNSQISNTNIDIKFWAMYLLANRHFLGLTALAQKDKIEGLKEAEKIYKSLAAQDIKPKVKSQAIFMLVEMNVHGQAELSRTNKVEAFKEAERLLKVIINEKNMTEMSKKDATKMLVELQKRLIQDDKTK